MSVRLNFYSIECQSLSDAKKPGITVEVEKLVNEWPSEVIKHTKEEDRKVYYLIHYLSPKRQKKPCHFFQQCVFPRI